MRDCATHCGLFPAVGPNFESTRAKFLRLVWRRRELLGLSEEEEQEDEEVRGEVRGVPLEKPRKGFYLQVRWNFRIVSGKGCLKKSKDSPRPGGEEKRGEERTREAKSFPDLYFRGGKYKK